MSNLLSEANAFYFVASSLATLTLLTSLALIVTSNVPLPLILALATLSVLVLALLYKIIRNNKNKDLRDKNVELEAKVKGQLEHKIPSCKSTKKLQKLFKLYHKIKKYFQFTFCVTLHRL